MAGYFPLNWHSWADRMGTLRSFGVTSARDWPGRNEGVGLYYDRLPPRRGYPIFGLLDYQGPVVTWQSMNLGDYIQTLSLMSLLAPHLPANIRGGGADCMRMLTLGMDKEPPEGYCQLATLDRDALNGGPSGFGGWLFVHGWHGGRREGWHLIIPPPGWHPLYVSVHLSSDDLLTADEWRHLRRYEPIGCRDLHTLDIVRGRGISGYFSGCVSQALRLPGIEFAPEVEPGAVGVNAPTNYQVMRRMTHAIPLLRRQTFSENVELAYHRMMAYRAADAVYTGRLHAWLPIIAVGGKAYLTYAGDERFKGYVGLTHADHGMMGGKLRGAFDLVVPMIVGGCDPLSVYGAWGAYVNANYDVA